MTSPDFQTIRNFRDCGGYALAGGGVMKRGMLFRSAHFPDASDEDLAQLPALGIATIVDLRRDSERAMHPHRLWPECRVVLRTQRDGETLPPHLAAFRDAGESPEKAIAAMRAIYREMPYDPMLIDLYRAFFESLAENDGAVLVHCAAGKDRTGIIVALAHHFLGVSPDDALHNYMLTNGSRMQEPEVIARMQEDFRRDGRPAEESAIATVLSVRPDYLEEAFAAMRERSGSADGYLSDVLNLSPRRQAVIRERLSA